MRTGLVAGAIAGALTLAACSGGGEPAVDANGTIITLPEPAAGPVPSLPVNPEAQLASPLPEIAVRQINGDGGWVQFKNELPADKPLLVWFWAPH